MSNNKSLARETCTLLAVFCGNYVNRQSGETEKKLPYPFPEIASAGRVEVHKLVNPTFDQFKEAQRTVKPIILFCQGERLSKEEEIGSLIWGNVDASDSIASLINPPLPTIVYLEVPNSEKITQSLHSKGVPYIIYWKNQFSSYSALHFHEALVSVVQSSLSHTWDAFQLASASFRLFWSESNHISRETNGQRVSINVGPHLLGDAPKINVSEPEANKAETEENEEQDWSEASSAIKIYEEVIDVKFLICGLQCAKGLSKQRMSVVMSYHTIMGLLRAEKGKSCCDSISGDAFLLGSLEDGLSALLNVEIRGSKLQNRISAAPPPLEARTLNHGIVTMRCDITTCSSAYISLLVSGGAQTCFDEQLLERHIKKDLIEKTRLVRAVPSLEETNKPQCSLSVACGAPVFEVCMAIPKWAAQVLKYLAKDASYRSLVALGIASVEGTPVASFDKRDVNRILFFSRENKKELQSTLNTNFHLLRYSSRPSMEIAKPCLKPKPISSMRPIHHSKKHKFSIYLNFEEPRNKHSQGAVDIGNKSGSALVAVPAVKQSPVKLAPKVVHRKQASQPVPINPLPMKKHGCTRLPIRICSEEEFLKDVMHFLVQRGHNKLVPQAGLSEFPDAILNAKRLDIYNLYKEVVSRGGFYVGNGINWKGQVFSKMRNHTISNKMTGVGNTLKRHYETYLLEYELAHDDVVDGECCLLCHSSAPGDWVNCGLCGEWAHFGCDRRQSLGTFKDYAKTDGLEYICPHCSVTVVKKKSRKDSNGVPTK